jgi:N-acetylglucosamine kinase-like BadF-type ATPase
MSYYIGVDGGGTKTAYALFDENKNILAEFKGPGSNHENLETSFEGASDIIIDGINSLCESAGIKPDNVSYTLMGLAGIDHPYQHDAMCELLSKKGLNNFSIYNDGFLVIKAGSETGAAIGYNCGTGVCCNCVDSDGNMLQLAGLGDFTGDFCGGVWIAQQTFRMIYDDVFCLGEKTSMSKKAFDLFKLKNREDLFEILKVLESDEPDEYIRPLLDIFFEAADEGDAQALKLVETMSDRGALFISALAKQMNFEGDEIEVVLSGSVNVKLANEKYISLLKEKAQARSPKKLCFKNIKCAPVTGCINWILQEFA